MAVLERFDLFCRLFIRVGRQGLRDLLGVRGHELGQHVLLLLAAQERAVARLRSLAALAAESGIPLIFLKSTAIELGGYAPRGARNACDVDILVRHESARTLWDTLVRQGWRPMSGFEGDEDHSLPLLRHPSGVPNLEIHWCLFGVDVRGRGRFATADELLAGDIVEPATSFPAGSFVPKRELIAAHAAAHGIGQHGYSLDYGLFRVPADLIDLGFGESPPPSDSPIWNWTRMALSKDEMSAAFELTRSLASADLSLLDERSDSPAGRLLRHFVAGASSEQYRRSLRLWSVWDVVSERPRAVVVAKRLWHAVFPTRSQLRALYGPPRYPWSASIQRLLRPLDLCLRVIQNGLAWLMVHLRKD